MSKTLVIHPHDKSTLFLSKVYEGKGYDVITDIATPNQDIIKAIESHDRILMMGHGIGEGLLNPACMQGMFVVPINRYLIIDDSHADLLRTKDTLSIWCNSDIYFRRNKIPGFHTGIIISECSEQKYLLGKVYLSPEEQLKNMERFSTIVGEAIEENPEVLKNHILEKYTGDDPVTIYNRSKLFIL